MLKLSIVFVVKIYSWVCEQYDQGRITMISDEELEEQYKKCSRIE